MVNKFFGLAKLLCIVCFLVLPACVASYANMQSKRDIMTDSCQAQNGTVLWSGGTFYCSTKVKRYML